MMSRTSALAVLFVAAVLEVCGDAMVRAGLHRSSSFFRLFLFIGGACVLFVYGWLVNAPPWDFGRLLGLYVVFFFVIAQVISWLAFGKPPGAAILVGGVLIVTGGLVIAFS